jgi:hypothetical protein
VQIAIIPAFNEEALIAKTLESLCDQTVPAAQIIVITLPLTRFQVSQSFEERLPIQVLANRQIAGNIRVLKSFKPSRKVSHH